MPFGGRRKFRRRQHHDPTVKLRVEESSRRKHIAQINFGLLSGAEMVKLSHIQVCNHELYQINTRIPTKYGCLDPRLGVSDKVRGRRRVGLSACVGTIDLCGPGRKKRGTHPMLRVASARLWRGVACVLQKSFCKTCGHELSQCAGHFGYLKLALPVFHIGYFKATLDILHNICKTCSRVLLDDGDLQRFTARMRDPMVGALFKVKLRKVITDKCRKQRTCPHCMATNGRVKILKSANSLKFLHEKCVGACCVAVAVAQTPKPTCQGDGLTCCTTHYTTQVQAQVRRAPSVLGNVWLRGARQPRHGTLPEPGTGGPVALARAGPVPGHPRERHGRVVGQP